MQRGHHPDRTLVTSYTTTFSTTPIYTLPTTVTLTTASSCTTNISSHTLPFKPSPTTVPMSPCSKLPSAVASLENAGLHKRRQPTTHLVGPSLPTPRHLRLHLPSTSSTCSKTLRAIFEVTENNCHQFHVRRNRLRVCVNLRT